MTKQLVGLLTIVVGALPSYGFGNVVLDQSGIFGPAPSSEPRRFEFELREPGELVVLATTVELTQGKLALRVTGPDGKESLNLSARSAKLRQPVDTSYGIGKYVLELLPEDAIGPWSAHITTEGTTLTTEEARSLTAIAASGVGMIIVGVAAVTFWRLRSKASWRWFWVGAAMWAVGVALKFAWAIPLNAQILKSLEASLPRNIYLTFGSIYIGLLSGIFEIGITLMPPSYGRKWRTMPREEWPSALGQAQSKQFCSARSRYSGCLQSLSQPDRRGISWSQHL